MISRKIKSSKVSDKIKEDRKVQRNGEGKVKSPGICGGRGRQGHRPESSKTIRGRLGTCSDGMGREGMIHSRVVIHRDS
jgi:hypothetical protein